MQQPKLIEIPNTEEPDVITSYTFTSEITELQSLEIPNIIHEKAIESKLPFSVLEEKASFPGGFDAWAKFLNKNFRYPKQAKKMGIEGTVRLNFIVNASGSISNITVDRSIGGGCDEEAIRVLSKSPKWNPGKQRGMPVKSRQSVNITFKLQ